MPEDKDSLGLKGLFGLDDVLGKVLAVVRNLSPHVVDEEWLSEVVFVVRVGHRLEVERHGGTGLNITDLEAAGGSVAVSVEELGDVLAVLREQRVGSVGLPLLVEVHHVVSLWGEDAAKFLVGKQLVKNVDLVNLGLSTLISNASSSDEGSGDEVEFPERSVSEHHEGETTVGNKGLGPHVVAAVKTSANLVEVVTSAHAPFPVVSVDHVSNILELAWVSLGLGGLGTGGAVVGGGRSDVVSIVTLGGLEAHVVEAGVVVLAEAGLSSWREQTLRLLLLAHKSYTR